MLEHLPTGETEIAFEYAFKQAPLSERVAELCGPSADGRVVRSPGVIDEGASGCSHTAGTRPSAPSRFPAPAVWLAMGRGR
jgi:hypothetical protein